LRLTGQGFAGEKKELLRRGIMEVEEPLQYDVSGVEASGALGIPPPSGYGVVFKFLLLNSNRHVNQLWA
jgi:hypothetical protein